MIRTSGVPKSRITGAIDFSSDAGGPAIECG
jgi:hypothetical protein